MYIVKVELPKGIFYVETLTATALTFTANWRKAVRFPIDGLPDPDEIESSTVKIIGYDAV